MTKSKAYQVDLIESLRDPREAEEYLNAALEEEDMEPFSLALRNVVEAHGGMGRLAETTRFKPERLSLMLSQREHLDLKSLDAILRALGFRLAVTSSR